MADQKISELIEKTTLADTDLMPMVDIEAIPDETKKITGANVKAQVLAGHKDSTTGVHGVGASTVCSEATADSKITTHKGDASAHHTKTADNEVAGLLSQGLASARPAAGIAGRLYYSTDTGVLERDTGTAWEEKARGETAIRLAQLSEKAHASLTGVTADQHHPQAHTLASHSTKAHSELTGIGKSDHHSNVITITFIIDGGGSAITTGEKGHLEIPFACTITQVTMLADVSGSIVVDIWKDTYVNFPPADVDSITASAPPTISAAQKSQDSTLTGWTTAVAAGDILAFNVDSAATITRVTISLKVEKS